MSHLYKASEWQSANGQWFCNDTTELAGPAAYWWVPARILGISPADYIEKLVKDFKPDHISFNNILIFSWNNINAMRKYKNWINAEARKKNFII